MDQTFIAKGLPIAFHGTVIHSLSPTDLQILPNTFLLIDTAGKIQALVPNTAPETINTLVAENGYAPDVFPVKHLPRTSFLIPGFIDTHHHAPQWAQRGVGRGRSLLDWLENITFAHEAKFADPAYAEKMYGAVVDGLLNQGITTAAYYASKHLDATKILARICATRGQRALVGRCNMNRHAPDWYRDADAEVSVAETAEFIAWMRGLDVGGGDGDGDGEAENALVKPVITPRFAISCDETVLAGLGELARQNPDLPIQTHFNEAEQEIEFTRQLFPGFKHEAELYQRFGLLGERSILAHCIFLQEEEMEVLKSAGCGVAHCPISNTTMQAFMVAPVREYLRRGIKVGLGTDSGGGHSVSMLEVMKQAFVVSTARATETRGADPALGLNECFFLATLGGAQVCGLEDKVGSFAVGKEFDALEIVAEGGVMTPVEDDDSIEIVLEKFLMTGDDRNIAKVYVRGRAVKV
ncbi:putative guanine deaminase [Aspergillus clavatus NRRL 1]|uniref:Guanine deaminase n=1 Tax=Aspergillus clavatus (strain ATCC 1007 / CBS 513.65 / DSM 816 / NCTC 3887 / NRRL 1 / QM 1276 / 107) TaxID=344612 RepID=A1CTR2_ASPCL|nr:guanine deaminase, putative [Aspergillus clavatus NRRL 1]EAW06699.1 guanine deaminase, putative [Aspergillus clavatus NRRL 1]